MSLNDLSRFEKKELYDNKPDIQYLQIIWFSADEINKKIGINVLDIIENEAMLRNQEHFIENMFQMIENWNINQELWIWENKYNKKVNNFISKSDWELLKLWIDIKNIIKIRIKTDKRNFLSNLLELIEINPYEIINNFIINYLINMSDYNKIKLWLNMSDLDILNWAFKKSKKNIN